jgi:hypothetical protein
VKSLRFRKWPLTLMQCIQRRGFTEAALLFLVHAVKTPPGQKEEPLNDYEKMDLQRASSKHILTLNQLSKILNLMTLPAGTEK